MHGELSARKWPGLELGEVSEQQPFNPSNTSARVKEEGCVSVHTSFKSQGEEQDDRARLRVDVCFWCWGQSSGFAKISGMLKANV